jgi:hypothetical protein
MKRTPRCLGHEWRAAFVVALFVGSGWVAGPAVEAVRHESSPKRQPHRVVGLFRLTPGNIRRRSPWGNLVSDAAARCEDEERPLHEERGFFR